MFYNFAQNNSGGYFVKDNEAGVCEEIIIEADTSNEADERLEEIGSSVDGFYDYCSCCGKRWSTGWGNDDEGTEKPEIYGTEIDKVKKDMFRNRCYVHYKDGRKVEHVFSDKD